MKYKHLFGPVMSRRLGISLGIDLVPYKYCPFNCVYCEVQSTTNLTTDRREFFPTEQILAELDCFMATQPELDYITFSGAGEPTLNSGIKRIIDHIKSKYPSYKLALLTNGVLLNDPNVLQEILPCDAILPSLDAASQEVYEKVNRPLAGLKVEDLIEGLVKLRKLYKGKIWLEVFIIPNITDTISELTLLRDAIQKMSPDIVQLNSLDRPGTEEWVEAATPQRLNEIKKFFEESLTMPVEIIAKAAKTNTTAMLDTDIMQMIEGTLRRRPSTVEDISQMLEIHVNEISKLLRELCQENKVVSKREARGVFYTWIG